MLFMKKKLFNIPIQVSLLTIIVFSSCEKGSRGGKKYDAVDRGNAQKTSTYGGCDFHTDCWDYKGSSFQTDFGSSQLQSRCQAEGGQFVANGCSDQNIVASCVINVTTAAETILHFYKISGLNVEDANQLCTAQGGALKIESTPVTPKPLVPIIN
jgi:hypothetical protein